MTQQVPAQQPHTLGDVSKYHRTFQNSQTGPGLPWGPKLLSLTEGGRDVFYMSLGDGDFLQSAHSLPTSTSWSIRFQKRETWKFYGQTSLSNATVPFSLGGSILSTLKAPTNSAGKESAPFYPTEDLQKCLLPGSITHLFQLDMA